MADAAKVTLDQVSAPMRWARRLRRVTIVLAIAAGIVFFTRYGTEWAPSDSTVPAVPANAWCIVDRWQSAAAAGRNVFFDRPGQGLQVDAVTAVTGDTLTLASFGTIDRHRIRGTILVVFPRNGH